MRTPVHVYRWPNESEAYRTARNTLLAAEIDLRRQTETVAALRRALPPGGPLTDDYVFETGPTDLTIDEPVRQIRLGDLLDGTHDTLVVYGFMFPPEGHPCPMCTAFLDALSGNAGHIGERVVLAIAAKAPLVRLRRWAAIRQWRFPHLLSSGQNDFNRDYHAESTDGRQWPMVNVFRRSLDGLHHVWASEMFLAPPDPNQHPRHVDALWPLWNVLDLTPAGRGEDMPMASYRSALAVLEST